MKIFSESSFFKERRAPVLPTPTEIRAINKESGNIRSTSTGADVAVVEAQTQMMLREQLQSPVPIPEVFGWTEDGGQRFICMSLIEGKTLQERWYDMNEDEKRAICEQLKPLVNAWRALEQDTHDRYIGGKQT
ncbi:hypothetical protein BJV74DRAFT_829021 [Russula compacta]|nr:hypothetical protein BJV74DRAFT_829021 [Russula compacta]